MRRFVLVFVLVIFAGSFAYADDVPHEINYQGYVTSGGSAFSGTGYFKFMLANDGGTSKYWCNDDNTPSADPSTALSTTVSSGVFNVILGAGTTTNQEILTSVFTDYSTVYLHVWFSTDNVTFEKLSPNKQVVSSPYAYNAYEAYSMNGGTIAGATIATSNITVGSGKTLDVSGGTLTLANDQISGDKITGGTIGSIAISVLSGAMNCNDQDMNNVDINSGTVDGLTVLTVDNISLDGNTISATNDSGLYLYDNGSNGIFIKDGGNVGIGDTDPDNLLEILSSGAANTQLSITNTNAGDYDAQIGFQLSDGTNLFTMGIDDDDSDKFKIGTSSLGVGTFFAIDPRILTSGVSAITIAGISPTIASAADAEYTTLTVTPPSITLTGTTQVTSQMDSINISQPTITDTSAITVDDATTLTIAGAPDPSGSVTLTETYGLKIGGGSVSGATTAYSLYVEAPTGATSNYAAVFMNGKVGIGTNSPACPLTVAGPAAFNVPATKTEAYTMTGADSSLIFNGTGAITLTLQSASNNSGRILYVKTIANFPVNSASGNVVPRNTATAGTAILTGTAGAWAMLQSDGSNWVIMAGS